MTARGCPARVGSPRHLRVLVTEAAITILDENPTRVAGASAPVSEELPTLTIDRRSGRATESSRNAAEVLEWCRRKTGSAATATGLGGAAYILDGVGSGASTPLASVRELRVFAILGALAIEAPLSRGCGNNTVGEATCALLVVTEAECVCEIDGKTIYEVVTVERLPLAQGSPAVADASGGAGAAGHSGVVGALIDHTTRHLCEKGFYFSQDLDITHTLQWKKRRVIEARRLGGDPLHRPADRKDVMATADPRFVWNRRLVEQFTRQGISSQWFVPLMQGHVQAVHLREPISECPGWVIQLTLLLISRRGSGRAGTRYNARGLDDNGEVANFIETEQLVRFRLATSPQAGGPSPRCPQGWLSLVQLRGSVPLFWEQSPQGPVQLTRELALAEPAFFRHQRSTEDAYEGPAFYANLLSDAAHERLLTEALEKQLLSGSQADRRIGSSLYRHIDFHTLVRGASQASFDSELDGLLEELGPFLKRSGHLDATTENPAEKGGAEPRRWQSGVLRTNCLDCLDRTNVVQFYVAWSWLRTFCWRYPVLHSLLDNKAPPNSATNCSGSSTLHMAGTSLLDGAAQGAAALSKGAAALQKAGTSFFDGLGLFGGGGASAKTMAAAGRGHGASDDLLNDLERLPPMLRQLLQALWADQGDRLSFEYTGAKSSTSLMVRQGQMTSLAMLEKSIQGINRAYQASFQDSQRQECIDLLLGLHRFSTELPYLRCSLERLGPGDVSGSMALARQRSQVGEVSIWAGTWNVNGREVWAADDPVPNGGLGAWLGPETNDIVVFCLQEVVELSATSIVLNAHGDESRAARFAAAAQAELEMRGAYVKVHNVGMVGLLCIAFVRAPFVPLVRDVRVTRVKSGVYGSAGNKGAVALRFQVLATSLCFLCVHLESGADKADVRMSQLRDALRCFDGVSPPIPGVADHDVLVVAGDLNTRLDLAPGAEVGLHQALRSAWAEEAKGADAAWRSLLRYDQLSASAQQYLHPLGILEGPVEFPPTYRFVVGGDEYDTARTPAWCDRVLYRSVGARLRAYRAVREVRGSDHRPVFASLQAILLGDKADRERFEVLRRELIAPAPSAGAATAVDAQCPLPVLGAPPLIGAAPPVGLHGDSAAGTPLSDSSTRCRPAPVCKSKFTAVTSLVAAVDENAPPPPTEPLTGEPPPTEVRAKSKDKSIV